MTTELLTLIAVHFACSQMSDTHLMTQTEIEHCTAVYDNVKLSFVPGVSARNFAELSVAEKSAVNTAGYLAFSAWRDANADTVAHLQRVARGEEALKAPEDL